MKTVYKYPLNITDRQWVHMPRGCQVLKVAMQDRVLTAWALVDTASDLAPREFLIFGTGSPCDIPTHRPYQYIDSVFEDHGVWHVWAAL